ncbi:hypothetical protein [Streptomyces sp. NPDC088915]|uniref:hypothetical protein n=1 Tax=Streptomyces sp. NPDC088915 TaxID=3365912 RepID=UPI003817E229
MRYPSTGCTDLDLDVPRAAPAETDSLRAEWTFKQPGLLATRYGMYLRTPTGLSTDGTAFEACRSAVDVDALPGEPDEKAVDEDFAVGSVLCTVTQEGHLAMMEITDVRKNDGAPDLFGRPTLWKVPGA